MDVPKVLVVARRFWPFTDDGCHRLMHFCSALQRAGAAVTILTARWHASWPEFSLCREVPIHRLLPSPATNWNESHFQKNVANWITKNVSDFDVIYVDRSDGLLATLQSKASKWNLPVIARFYPEDAGYGLSNGQRMSQIAMADACRRCYRVVAPTPSSHRLLISQGIQDSQIVRIGDISWERIQRTDELRVAASNALFDVCSDFVSPSRTDILLHLGVTQPKPLKLAVQSVCDYLDTGVLMRMWIVGCGLPPNAIYDLIKSRGWHREILLFDGFDDLGELIRIADLAIATNPAETLQYSLPVMAQAGVPAMIADTPDCRSWLPDSNHFQLYSDEVELDERLRSWLTQRERWVSSANSLRQSLLRAQSVDDCAKQWIHLFRDSITERRA